MALLALPGCPLVDHRRVTVNFAPLGMAHLARHPLMGAIQFESGMTAVIEFGGPPSQNRMAAGASLVLAGCMELAAVHVGMTAGAIYGGAMEGDSASALFEHWLMARQTIHRGVTAEQRVGSLAMIESATF